MTTAVSLLLSGFLSCGVAADARPGKSRDSLDSRVHAAIARSLPYLEREGVRWMEERKCVSCHQIPSMLWSLNLAEQSGFDVSREKLEDWYRWSIERTQESEADPEKKPAVENMVQLILGRSAPGERAEMARIFADFPGYILAQQEDDGAWAAGGQLPFQKRPKEETQTATVMWTVLALAAFEDGDAGIARSRQRGMTWLEEHGETGISTESVAVDLLLQTRWGTLEKASAALRALLGRQEKDGGWAWRTGKPSDALATGQVLYALSLVEGAGVRNAIRRGQRFLVSTQGDDGVWIVPTTKNPKKGKPADEPTDVSNYWGTAWALAGLLHTLPSAVNPAGTAPRTAARE